MIAEETLKFRLNNILSKLEASDRTQIRINAESGLFDFY